MKSNKPLRSGVSFCDSAQPSDGCSEKGRAVGPSCGSCSSLGSPSGGMLDDDWSEGPLDEAFAAAVAEMGPDAMIAWAENRLLLALRTKAEALAGKR